MYINECCYSVVAALNKAHCKSVLIKSGNEYVQINLTAAHFGTIEILSTVDVIPRNHLAILAFVISQSRPLPVILAFDASHRRPQTA